MQNSNKTSNHLCIRNKKAKEKKKQYWKQDYKEHIKIKHKKYRTKMLTFNKHIEDKFQSDQEDFRNYGMTGQNNILIDQEISKNQKKGVIHIPIDSKEKTQGTD